MAGMRVGFSVSNPNLARLLFAVKPMYEITTISALLAGYVLGHYDRVFEYAKKTREGKDYLTDFFREKGFDVMESYANFLHVDFGDKRDEIIDFLLKKKVLFKEAFEEEALKHFSRFTIGPKESLMPLVELFNKLEGNLKKCRS